MKDCSGGARSSLHPLKWKRECLGRIIIRHERWIIIPAQRFRFRGWIFQRDATADFIRRVSPRSLQAPSYTRRHYPGQVCGPCTYPLPHKYTAVPTVHHDVITDAAGRICEREKFFIQHIILSIPTSPTISCRKNFLNIFKNIVRSNLKCVIGKFFFSLSLSSIVSIVRLLAREKSVLMMSNGFFFLFVYYF